jgi:hypothetical protein
MPLNRTIFFFSNKGQCFERPLPNCPRA